MRPEGTTAADEVLPQPALRLVQGRRSAGRERRPCERRRDLPLVEAVAELVHAREDPAQMRLVEVRRYADVSQRGGHREWMLHGVEPPRVGIEPELPQQLDREALLRIDVEGTRPRDIVVRVELRHR